MSVGDLGRRPQRFSHWSSSLHGISSKPSPYNNDSKTHSSLSEPSPYNNVSKTPSAFCRWQTITRQSLGPDGAEAKPDRVKVPLLGEGGGGIAPKATPRWKPQAGGGPQRRASARRRSSCSATQHSGHMSHPHSWGTKIFINHKGL
jgi:hypothetical protein